MWGYFTVELGDSQLHRLADLEQKPLIRPEPAFGRYATRRGTFSPQGEEDAASSGPN
jgi:hypothetical protein